MTDPGENAGRREEVRIKRKRATRIIWLIIVSIWIMLSFPSSSGVMYTFYSPERMRDAAIPPGFPLNCSAPLDEKWMAKVSSIRWVNYSSPNPGRKYRQPTSEDINKDLTALKKAGFTGLVTYGSSGIMGKEFPVIAQSLGFQGIIMGVWNPLNEKEMGNAKNAASLPIVIGYSIGNEGLYGIREKYSLRDLCSAMADLRTSTGKPVATSEEIDDYSFHPELLFAGDWLFPIAHPYWHSTKYPLDAVKWEVTRYHDMVESTKRFVLFKEVGLPTSGARGLSETSHDVFYRELAKTEVRFVYFEGFDQPSKTTSSVERYWGIFNAGREPKLLGWNLMGYRLFTSDGVNDGTILECSESSGRGCRVDSTASTLTVGDDASNRLFRALLSFNTAGLPDDAVVTSVKLKIKLESVTGGNPFHKRRILKVDSCRSFGSSLKLHPADFEVSENCASAGDFESKPENEWYIARLLPASFPNIDLSGTTQFRLRYNTNDKDLGADFVRFYSGKADDQDKPVLLVRYTIP